MNWIPILNVISTIAATAAVWGSYLATKEATRAQKASFTPVMEPVDFWINKIEEEKTTIRFEMEIKNIGQFVAQSITVKAKGIERGLISSSVDNLEPGETNNYYHIRFEDFDIIKDFLSTKDNRVIIQYSDIFGNKLNTVCLLEFDINWDEARSKLNRRKNIEINIKDWFFRYEIDQ